MHVLAQVCRRIACTGCAAAYTAIMMPGQQRMEACEWCAMVCWPLSLLQVQAIRDEAASRLAEAQAELSALRRKTSQGVQPA
jgi:hypothetical protein